MYFQICIYFYCYFILIFETGQFTPMLVVRERFKLKQDRAKVLLIFQRYFPLVPLERTHLFFDKKKIEKIMKRETMFVSALPGSRIRNPFVSCKNIFFLKLVVMRILRSRKKSEYFCAKSSSHRI